MREMAIFGVPCWGLMVSEGVPGSNDRAERANCPNRGHAIPNTGKIYAAPELPSLAVGTGSSVFGSSGGFEVQLLWKCFWCTNYQDWIWGWICQKLDSDQHHPFDTTLNFDEEKRNQWQGQICQKGLRGAIEVSQVVTQLSTDMKTTGQPNPSFLFQIPDSGTILQWPDRPSLVTSTVQGFKKHRCKADH